MDLLRSGDEGYDEARTLFNAMIDKHPAVIARCASAGDVADALAFARSEKLDIAVRAGGHSVAGVSMNDGGLVIDVRPMDAVEVDGDAHRVRCGSGVTWGPFDRATQKHGLATTGGRVSTTGVAGLTLGGGSGWTERAWGLACDNLVSVELVTVEGRTVTASEKENPDLFWALHGGGGNFGVATAFEFALRPLGPEVMAGLMAWPSERAEEVARLYRDLAADAPRQLGSALVFLTGPPEEFIPEHLRGTTLIAVVGLWVGDPADGAEVVQPLRDLSPEVDLLGPMPYADFQCMIDDPPGLMNYWTADYHDEFDDDALEVFLEYGSKRCSPQAQALLVPWGGAVAEVADDATPMTGRSVKWVSHPFAVWDDPDVTDASIAWARGFRRDLAAFTTGGTYLNFIGSEGTDRVRAAFGDNYERLAQIKAQWDPDNLLRGNHNIEPER